MKYTVPWIDKNRLYRGGESPPEDVNVLAFVVGVGWRVCYLYDNRWTYTVSETWGFDVSHWKCLDEDPKNMEVL